ncbi:MAG: acyl-CoA dehydrogenase family protein [Porticoccaceae bacterium]
MTQPKDFGFDDDAAMLRDTARKFLADHLPTDKLHRLVAANSDPYRTPTCDWDPELWRQIVALGWTTVAVPESEGGMGMNLTALAALAEEVGRAALPSPFITTALATLVLRECDSEPARKLLGEIARGRAATLATTPRNGAWEVDACDVRLEDGKLRGGAWFVQDARKADTLIVKAATTAGIALCAVPVTSAGVDIVPDAIIDLTRDQAHIQFNGVAIAPDQLLAAPGTGAAALEAAEPALLAIVAADMCGAAEWLLQTTAEYARLREQFGHRIGYFQAVKHPLVNLMIALDQAKSLVYNAACAVDNEPDRAPAFARMAKAAASDVAAYGSNRAIQFHGGIGFTWECSVHLYTKRQKHNQMFYGDASHQRAKLAELLMGAVG